MILLIGCLQPLPIVILVVGREPAQVVFAVQCALSKLLQSHSSICSGGLGKLDSHGWHCTRFVIHGTRDEIVPVWHGQAQCWWHCMIFDDSIFSQQRALLWKKSWSGAAWSLCEEGHGLWTLRLRGATIEIHVFGTRRTSVEKFFDLSR